MKEIQGIKISLLRDEFEFTTSKSSGKGGQHVNKTESRVELRWNFMNSNLLSTEQKSILETLKSVHIVRGEELYFASEISRSQHKNKATCVEKALIFLDKHLKVKRKRKATKVPKAVKEKRLKAKKHNAEIKANRKAIK